MREPQRPAARRTPRTTTIVRSATCSITMPRPGTCALRPGTPASRGPGAPLAAIKVGRSVRFTKADRDALIAASRYAPPVERPGRARRRVSGPASGHSCHHRPVIMAAMDAATAAIYEEAAPRWQQSRGAASDELGRRFRSQAGDGLVVDLGCGPGRYLDQIGAQVVGVDVCWAMLALARSRGRPLARADLESLPFGNGVFSGAFARHSYLHVPKQGTPRAFSELKRVLRPGGFLMLSLIEGDYEGHNLRGDDFPGRYFALWTIAELRDALGGAGFVDIAVERVPRPRGEADLLATAGRATAAPS